MRWWKFSSKIEERRGERAVVEGKGPVEEGQGGGTKGDVFAITCALRYRGGRLERKQCRLSTCTFIRGEPKTNRNPSRGHGYTNALLPGNSIRFRRVWSSVVFATRLHFLPFDFELDSNYRLLSLNNAILFFHTRVLSTRAVSDHSVEYFSFGSQENPVKSVEITTRWKLVSSRLVSSCVARNERISRRGWRGQLFGCRCSGNSGISREWSVNGTRQRKIFNHRPREKGLASLESLKSVRREGEKEKSFLFRFREKRNIFFHVYRKISLATRIDRII